MNFNTWANSKLKNSTWVDVSLIKISAASFALMVAKLWEPLLSLDWLVCNNFCASCDKTSI
jgi:hypothetical protein